MINDEEPYAMDMPLGTASPDADKLIFDMMVVSFPVPQPPRFPLFHTTCQHQEMATIPPPAVSSLLAFHHEDELSSDHLHRVHDAFHRVITTILGSNSGVPFPKVLQSIIYDYYTCTPPLFVTTIHHGIWMLLPQHHYHLAKALSGGIGGYGPSSSVGYNNTEWSWLNIYQSSESLVDDALLMRHNSSLYLIQSRSTRSFTLTEPMIPNHPNSYGVRGWHQVVPLIPLQPLHDVRDSRRNRAGGDRIPRHAMAGGLELKDVGGEIDGPGPSRPWFGGARHEFDPNGHPKMDGQRHNTTTVVYDDKIFYIGGQAVPKPVRLAAKLAISVPIKTIEWFDIKANLWKQPMAPSFWEFGNKATTEMKYDRYDAGVAIWSPRPPSSVPAKSSSSSPVTLPSSRRVVFIVCGGDDAGTIEVIDPANGTSLGVVLDGGPSSSSSLSSFPTPHRCAVAVSVPNLNNGAIFISPSSTDDRAYIYDPATNVLSLFPVPFEYPTPPGPKLLPRSYEDMFDNDDMSNCGNRNGVSMSQPIVDSNTGDDFDFDDPKPSSSNSRVRIRSNNSNNNTSNTRPRPLPSNSNSNSNRSNARPRPLPSSNIAPSSTRAYMSNRNNSSRIPSSSTNTTNALPLPLPVSNANRSNGLSPVLPRANRSNSNSNSNIDIDDDDLIVAAATIAMPPASSSSSSSSSRSSGRSSSSSGSGTATTTIQPMDIRVRFQLQRDRSGTVGGLIVHYPSDDKHQLIVWYLPLYHITSHPTGVTLKHWIALPSLPVECWRAEFT